MKYSPALQTLQSVVDLARAHFKVYASNDTAILNEQKDYVYDNFYSLPENTLRLLAKTIFSVSDDQEEILNQDSMIKYFTKSFIYERNQVELGKALSEAVCEYYFDDLVAYVADPGFILDGSSSLIQQLGLIEE